MWSDVFTLLVYYFLPVRDWLIDEQALGTQYCECGETLVIHGTKR